jgi:hypothetical protein
MLGSIRHGKSLPGMDSKVSRSLLNPSRYSMFLKNVTKSIRHACMLAEEPIIDGDELTNLVGGMAAFGV